MVNMGNNIKYAKSVKLKNLVFSLIILWALYNKKRFIRITTIIGKKYFMSIPRSKYFNEGNSPMENMSSFRIIIFIIQLYIFLAISYEKRTNINKRRIMLKTFNGSWNIP